MAVVDADLIDLGAHFAGSQAVERAGGDAEGPVQAVAVLVDGVEAQTAERSGERVAVRIADRGADAGAVIVAEVDVGERDAAAAAQRAAVLVGAAVAALGEAGGERG